MSVFKVVHHGIEIHCENADAAIEIATKLAGAGITAVGNGNGKVDTGAGGGIPNSRWTVARYQNFTSQLLDKQRRFLVELVSSVDGVTDHALRQIMGVENNNGFGPIMSAISKRAKKEGIALDEILTTAKVDVGGERMLEFKVSPSFRKITEISGGLK